jgi:hypothetical protein
MGAVSFLRLYRHDQQSGQSNQSDLVQSVDLCLQRLLLRSDAILSVGSTLGVGAGNKGTTRSDSSPLQHPKSLKEKSLSHPPPGSSSLI